jgi:hypothetical protein
MWWKSQNEADLPWNGDIVEYSFTALKQKLPVPVLGFVVRGQC